MVLRQKINETVREELLLVSIYYYWSIKVSIKRLPKTIDEIEELVLVSIYCYWSIKVSTKRWPKTIDEILTIEDSQRHKLRPTSGDVDNEWYHINLFLSLYIKKRVHTFPNHWNSKPKYQVPRSPRPYQTKFPEFKYRLTSCFKGNSSSVVFREEDLGRVHPRKVLPSF